jgi:DNA uptake protein ComE-like DNA-binding protein
MKPNQPKTIHRRPSGSVLVIVLWIAFGLVSIALYFADSMSSELRASDNRVCGLAADQAIEGAARYVSYILANNATNGAVPDLTEYQAEAVPVGDAHFWIIGRNPTTTPSTEPYFALIDEASKLNLNYARTNALADLPNMTLDFATAIVDWRNTNGAGLYGLNYAQVGYVDKSAPFETVDELRLVYGSSIDLLVGEDVNRNGVLDENETDENHNGQVDPGIFEYVTVYSREPNVHSDGTAFTNVNNQAALRPLLQAQLGSARADQILSRFVTRTRGPGGRTTTRVVTVNNLLQFYLRSGMTSDEFAKVANGLTASNAAYVYGRVNVNTASAAVLACLRGMDPGTAQQLVNYRQANPTRLTSIAWIVDALGAGNTAIQSLAQGDYITTCSYQFSADIAALGPYGRGYRRTRFVFDLSSGAVQVVYRQDLSRLGWALGKHVRDTWVANETR